MAEVIGLVASVIQVAGAGLKLSETLYRYADGVATADRRIKDIAKEIELTSFVIEELGIIFKQDETSTLLSKNALKTADETVQECSSVFTELDVALKKSKKNTFGRLMLPFRDNKIELLRSHIDKLKSTLQLLMQVLTHAYQVAAHKLDRKTEAEQREQIKTLLDNKKKSTARYEESLKNFSMSEDSTLFDDDEAEKPNDDTRSIGNLMAAASSSSSSITTKNLETCVQHIQNLLEDLENLQKAINNQVDDHSEHEQSLIGSYFRARGHLDSVLFGSTNGTKLPNPAVNSPAPSSKDVRVDLYKTWTGSTVRSTESLGRTYSEAEFNAAVKEAVAKAKHEERAIAAEEAKLEAERLRSKQGHYDVRSTSYYGNQRRPVSSSRDQRIVRPEVIIENRIRRERAHKSESRGNRSSSLSTSYKRSSVSSEHIRPDGDGTEAHSLDAHYDVRVGHPGASALPSARYSARYPARPAVPQSFTHKQSSSSSAFVSSDRLPSLYSTDNDHNPPSETYKMGSQSPYLHVDLNSDSSIRQRRPNKEQSHHGGDSVGGGSGIQSDEETSDEYHPEDVTDFGLYGGYASNMTYGGPPSHSAPGPGSTMNEDRRRTISRGSRKYEMVDDYDNPFHPSPSYSAGTRVDMPGTGGLQESGGRRLSFDEDDEEDERPPAMFYHPGLSNRPLPPPPAPLDISQDDYTPSQWSDPISQERAKIRAEGREEVRRRKKKESGEDREARRRKKKEAKGEIRLRLDPSKGQNPYLREQQQTSQSRESRSGRSHRQDEAEEQLIKELEALRKEAEQARAEESSNRRTKDAYLEREKMLERERRLDQPARLELESMQEPEERLERERKLEQEIRLEREKLMEQETKLAKEYTSEEQKKREERERAADEYRDKLLRKRERERGRNEDRMKEERRKAELEKREEEQRRKEEYMRAGQGFAELEHKPIHQQEYEPQHTLWPPQPLQDTASQFTATPLPADTVGTPGDVDNFDFDSFLQADNDAEMDFTIPLTPTETTIEPEEAVENEWVAPTSKKEKKTMKRKNVKGLALASAPIPVVEVEETLDLGKLKLENQESEAVIVDDNEVDALLRDWTTILG